MAGLWAGSTVQGAAACAGSHEEGGGQEGLIPSPFSINVAVAQKKKLHLGVKEVIFTNMSARKISYILTEILPCVTLKVTLSYHSTL